MNSDALIKRNTVYNAIKTICNFIYPFISFPYASRILMPDGIGKVAFASSIVGYVALLASLGISVYAIRECSKVKFNKKQLERTASEIYSINIISMLFAYLCLFVFIESCSYVQNYSFLIIFLSCSVFFVTIGADWINIVFEDYKYLAIRTVFIQALSVIFLFLYVKSKDDYIYYAFISVFSASSSSILNYFYRKRFCKIRFIFKTNYKSHILHIVILFSMIFTQSIFTSSDIVILGFERGEYETGLYNMAVNIYKIINMLIASIAWVTLPQLSAAFKNKDFISVNSLLKYSLNYILTLGLPCVSGIIIICPHLLYAFFGENFVAASLSLRFLSVALVFSFLGGWICNMMLIPSGKDITCFAICCICALFNISLNLVFIPKWGLNAAAASSCFAQMIGFLISIYFVDKRIKLSSFLEVFYPTLKGCLGIIIIGGLVQLIVESHWCIVLITLSISIVWYLFFLFFVKNTLTQSIIKWLVQVQK